MTDTVIHEKKRNPWLNTIKDRPRHNTETKITPPGKLEEVISGIWDVVKQNNDHNEYKIRWIQDFVKQNQKLVDQNKDDIRVILDSIFAQRQEDNKKVTNFERAALSRESGIESRIENLEKMVKGHQHIEGSSAETKITPPVKLEQEISDVWDVTREEKRLIDEKLKKLESRELKSFQNLKSRIEDLEKIVVSHQTSITVLLDSNHERLNREVAKRTKRNAKKDNSAWSKVKRLLPYKDELAHKYIVD